MSGSKGKGRADPTKEDENVNGMSNTINNILSDVASSATGLAKSAFTAPSSNELSNASSSSVLGSGKAQPSSSSSGTSAYAESSKPTTSTSSYGQASPSQPQGLRSQHEQHAAAAEAEFSSFLDSVPVMEQSIPSDSFDQFQHPGTFSSKPLSTGQQTPGSYAGTGTDYPHPSSRFVPRTPPTTSEASTLSRASQTVRYKTVEEATAHDGMDVVNILGTFAPQEKDYFEPQTIEAEIEEWRLTPAQITLAKQLAAELHVPSMDNPSQMVPKAFQDGEKAEYLPEEYAFDSFSHLGEALPAKEAREKWISQWEEVLNRYQDEVWGGMLPLVKEAKQELEEGKVEGMEDRQPKALRRLGMVLSHLSHDHPQSQLHSQTSVPELLPEMETQPERPRRQFRHWTKEQEIVHREANNIPNPVQEHPLASFQKQLEILEEQNKKRLRILEKGGNGVYPNLVSEGAAAEWKDEYLRAPDGTVLGLKPEGS